MRIRICRNSVKGAPRWKKGRLPVRQTLIWVGPLFVLIQRGKRKAPA